MRLRRPLSRPRGCKRSQGTGLENFPGRNASVRANLTSPVGIRQGFCPGRAARARTEAPRAPLSPPVTARLSEGAAEPRAGLDPRVTGSPARPRAAQPQPNSEASNLQPHGEGIPSECLTTATSAEGPRWTRLGSDKGAAPGSRRPPPTLSAAKSELRGTRKRKCR